MASTRQAILAVSNELIGPLFDQHGPADGIARDWDWLRQALKLPATCTITGVSYHLRFMSNETVLRVKSQDFIETKEFEQLPEVEAIYEGAGFSHWQGPGVTQDYINGVGLGCRIPVTDGGQAKQVGAVGIYASNVVEAAYELITPSLGEAGTLNCLIEQPTNKIRFREFL